MASLLGFLGALGDQLGIGGDATRPGALTRLNNAADPVAAGQRSQAQLDQSSLLKYANDPTLQVARANGTFTPQMGENFMASINPSYLEKAATLQAQNPLAALLQGGQHTPVNPNAGPINPTADPSLPWSGQNLQNQKADLTSLSGSDLLKALPPAIAAQVKGIAEGTQQLPTGMGGAANRQALLQLVNQYDPTFDAVNFNARAATRKDFTSGKSAQNITAMNTALGHLSSLSDAYDKLGNTDYGWLNTGLNAVESAAGSKSTQTAMTDVQSKAHAVSEELAKVFRSTGMAESDVKAWEKQISTSATPSESKAVISAAVDLLNSRLDSLGQQYNQGMGTTKNGLELLSPKAQAAYQKITGSAAPETSASGNLMADNAKNAPASDPVAVARAHGYTQAQIDDYLKKRGK